MLQATIALPWMIIVSGHNLGTALLRTPSTNQAVAESAMQWDDIKGNSLYGFVILKKETENKGPDINGKREINQPFQNA
jgi:acyl-coenzyme A synthetase/AMP-(fatty) acid ligase